MHFARVCGAQPALPMAHEVRIETDVARGLHAFTIVGLPDKAVEEARDRVASAIKNSEFASPKATNKKIVISLAPAELKKEGATFDLPVALSYLLAVGDITFSTEGRLFAGELALDGTVRPVRGALSIAQAARRGNYAEIFLPSENADEASLISGITIYGIRSLRDCIDHLTGSKKLTPHARKEPTPLTGHSGELDEIRGQTAAKRALTIAAAGRHNISLYGPPGTGKTMLARAAASLLPDLSEDEQVEVTAIHSISGNLRSGVIVRAPFRAPHHTASYASLIGGGTSPRPGEVTLAHRGVLFLDEFPEFHRDVINALREPLEDRVVSVSRAKGSAIYPANFMLIAALNPCPCGYWGTERCQCMPHIIEKYRRKISGPIADRIDMWVSVGEMPLESLSLKQSTTTHETAQAREKVHKARSVQQARFAETPHLSTNADMKAKDIERFARVTEAAEDILMQAARKLKLSARGYHRTIKLARTIADMAESPSIAPEHMLEALQYRSRELA